MAKPFIFVLSLVLTCSLFAGEVLTLEESIQRALSNNPQTAVSSERVKQAESTKEEIHTYFLPKIGSSFTYTRLDKAQSMNMGGTSFDITDANLYNLALTLTQPLYTGGRISTAYAQAGENLNRTEIAMEQVIQNLAFEVKRGYFSILKAKAGLLTVTNLKDMAVEHLKTAEAFFNEGMVTKADVLKTEVFLADTEQQILQAKNSLALAKTGFSFLLNQPLSVDFEVEDIFGQVKEKKEFDYWTHLSLQSRPELKEMESVTKIQEYSIEIEKSNYKPQIAFFYNWVLNRGSQAPVDEWSDKWTAGIALELDIWNWGETRHRVERAQHQKEEVIYQHELLRNAIELEVKTAYLNMETAELQIETTQKSTEKAEENLRIMDLLYREGMATTTDVLGAQNDLASAKNNYSQALYNYQIAFAQLEKAAGITIKEQTK